MSKRFNRKIYKTARALNDLETLASGDPKKIAKRTKNKIYTGCWVAYSGKKSIPFIIGF